MGSRNFAWEWVPSDGAAAGLITVWKEEVFIKIDVSKTPRALFIKLTSVADGFTWNASNAYGSNEMLAREGFLSDLSNVMVGWGLPCCLGGDFNMVRFPYERIGRGRITPSMECFSDFIIVNELSDLPLTGKRFAWSNSQVRIAMSRLDRFLISKE